MKIDFLFFQKMTDGREREFRFIFTTTSETYAAVNELTAATEIENGTQQTIY